MSNNTNPQEVNRRKEKRPVIQLEKGRIPPQALDLEEAVLGAMLIDNAAINQVIDILQPETFYREQHGVIYKAMKHLFAESQPVDMLTVANRLRSEGELEMAGGDYYLVQLSQRVSSAANSEFHARIIVQKYIQREMIRVSGDIITKAFDETTDVFELLDQAEQDLFEVAHSNVTKNYSTADELVEEALKRIEEIGSREGLSGVPSGFKEVDKVTSGWQPSDLVIIAARPGMGKTAFVLSMARNIAIEHKKPIAIFSLEMSSVQLITRLISSETGLKSEKLRKGNLEVHEWQQLTTKVKHLENAPMYIDDTPALSIFDLRAKCRRLVAQHQVEIIVIDYLQLMSGGQSGKNGGNREQEISAISRSLKSIAKELNVPVIALSQLSRAVETRGGTKRPLLSDLRESGAIEQDADIVNFIYRPEYYQMTEWDDENQTPCEGQAEFIFAKHRNGGLDNVRLRFQGELAKFSDLEEEGEGGNFYESKINNGSFLDEPNENDNSDKGAPW